MNQKNSNTLLYLYILIPIIFAIFTVGCNSSAKQKEIILTTSIAPIKYIVETITCGDFHVEVLVPEGANPESYSPTASQMINVEHSKLIFTTGLLDFEQELVSKLPNTSNNIINLSNNITIINGTCGHINTPNKLHKHGVDPHIWTSPKQLRIIARNVFNAVYTAFPDSTKYTKAYYKLDAKLDSISIVIANKINHNDTKYFIIYHPALTYFAADYSLSQLSLENDGKEPSAQHMRSIIDMAHENKIKTILYQKQFSKTVVESIAKEINGKPEEINPLTYNIVDEILRITDIITTQK